MRVPESAVVNVSMRPERIERFDAERVETSLVHGDHHQFARVDGALQIADGIVNIGKNGVGDAAAFVEDRAADDVGLDALHQLAGGELLLRVGFGERFGGLLARRVECG